MRITGAVGISSKAASKRISRMRTFVARSDPASDVPASKALGPRPDLAAIIDAAADAFGEDPSKSRAGTRQDGGARAVAASLARLVPGQRHQTGVKGRRPLVPSRYGGILHAGQEHYWGSLTSSMSFWKASRSFSAQASLHVM